jgi:hypothetical protein
MQACIRIANPLVQNLSADEEHSLVCGWGHMVDVCEPRLFFFFLSRKIIPIPLKFGASRRFCIYYSDEKNW